MASNDVALVKQLLAQGQASGSLPADEAAAFEHLAARLITKPYGLSDEEADAGVIGGGNDGAIDSVHILFDDEVVREDFYVLDEAFVVSELPRGRRIALILTQAKRETGFKETAVDLAASSTRRLLDMNLEKEQLRDLYSDDVIDRLLLFRALVQKVAIRHPSIEIHFRYVAYANTAGADAKVRAKLTDLEHQFAEFSTGTIASAQLVGASELWELDSRVPAYSLELDFVEQATAGDSHIALVELGKYAEFISDDSGEIAHHLFDMNVRDYQGKVAVNEEIETSLRAEGAPDFWWLNNGVTIVCNSVVTTGKRFTIHDVQIVNGLQTSYTIHNVLPALAGKHPSRTRGLLVRLIAAGDSAVTRDQIIRSTNSQTAVQLSSLRATDEIQRKIEHRLLDENWFYDRRKNFYKNRGKPSDRIVSIGLLAQSVMAAGLGRPDDSRARPSSLLKRDVDYSEAFNASIPLDSYLVAVELQRLVDAFLASEEAGVERNQRTNLRFHLLTVATTKMLGYFPAAVAPLARLAQAEIDAVKPALSSLLQLLTHERDALVKELGTTADQVAKGTELVQRLRSDEFVAKVTGM